MISKIAKNELLPSLQFVRDNSNIIKKMKNYFLIFLIVIIAIVLVLLAFLIDPALFLLGVPCSAVALVITKKKKKQ